jgi:nitrous oxidase accessory protein NosD
VAAGTYKEQVTITQSISLVAQGDAVFIDATGKSNGILINGMATAPNPGVADVLISGFNVRNANYEGIFVVNATDVTLVGNHVSGNNKSLDVSGQTCPGINTAIETNEQSDCGEGIHLMGVDHSILMNNESYDNSGGILISDETGPSYDNVIKDNDIYENGYACGITMASHGPATSVIPTAKVSFGIMRNTIAHNISWNNGLLLPGAGAGVGIFAPFPGTTSSANVVVDNTLRGNGLPGVTMHNHASAPSPAPAVNLNDNVIVGNHFSNNAADTKDAATPGPTGINLYSTAPVTGTVIAQNVFDDEAVDIAFKAPAGQINAHFNDFSASGIGIDNLGKGTVNATSNWWHCPIGPTGSGCTTASGIGIFYTPHLSSPYIFDNPW